MKNDSNPIIRSEEVTIDMHICAALSESRSSGEILETYAKQNGFSNLRWYTDDGYSGANFQRPGFQAMLADIEAGKVGTVIVKDMSRLGRNYLQVGMYTEMIFPQKGVRFIAINDGVDSAQGDNDFAPLRNMMHFVELYHGEFSEERLIRALRSVHPMEIYRSGMDNPAKLPGWKKYVFPIYMAYNGKCRKDALPMKF
jgi:hypothetical protein